MRRTDSTTDRAAGLLPALALLLLPIGAPAQKPAPGGAGAAPEPGQAPPGITQVVPRGTLTSIDHPVFVPAGETDMPDEQWVLGVEIDGVAHAYDLNLLNHHEVVNDVIGDRPVAAVWCPLANTGVVYDREYGDQELLFEPSGALSGAALVMRDKQTDSWWSIMQPRAIHGEMAGQPLRELPNGQKTTWGEWRRRHPETLVLSIDGRTYEAENAYASYFADTERTYQDVEPDDDRLPAKEPIFAFRRDGEAIAVPHRKARGGFTFYTKDDTGVRDDRILLYRAANAELLESTQAYVIPKEYLMGVFVNAQTVLQRTQAALESGLAEEEGVSVLPGIDTFWYTWVAQNPETRIVD